MKSYFFLVLFLLIFTLSSFSMSVGGTTSGAASYCGSTNAGAILLSGHTGNILNWQLSTNGGVNWITVPKTTISLTYFNLSQTTCYRAVVKDGVFPADTSSITCITVSQPVTVGTLSGGGSFCGNATGTLTLAGVIADTLNWESSINGAGGPWSPISNTTNTFNYTNLPQTTHYRVIVKSTGGACPDDTSNIEAVNVAATTATGTISGPGSVCSTTDTGVLTLSGHTGTILGWISSINNGGTWTPITNTTTTLSYSNLTQETWYGAIVQGSGCPADTTPIKIIMFGSTNSGVLSGGGTFCGGGATGTLTLTGHSGNILGWESSTNGAGGPWAPISNTTNTENYTNLSQTTLYRVIVQSSGCPNDTSNNETVEVATQTITGSILSDTTVCPSTGFNLLLVGNVGSVLKWEYSIDGVSWIQITNTSTQHFVNGITAPTSYRAVVQNGGCSVRVTDIFPIGVFTVLPASAGGDFVINLGESVILSGSGTGTPLWNNSSSLNDPAIFTPTATPTATANYQLTVTDSNGCKSTDIAVVSVNDTAKAVIITTLFTPNDDGVNDFWHIEDIDKHPDNEVFVYNIYGSLVFSETGYLNNWSGTYNGNPLPDATYYFVVKLDAESDPIKGALDILR